MRKGTHASAAEGGKADSIQEDLVSMLDGLFGLTMEQRTRCLGGTKAERKQESTTYQVCKLKLLLLQCMINMCHTATRPHCAVPRRPALLYRRPASVQLIDAA